MKNLFILPSEKPSRLLKSENNNFMIIKSDTPNWFEIILKNTYQNICIINDDEIKDNTWVLNIVNGDIYKTYKGKPFNKDTKKEKWRKIILTTDPILISDGVQAINDEFLEWFVKNPSCQKILIGIEIWNDGGFSYRIIIPKEEPKQETLEEVAERKFQNIGDRLIFEEGAKWQQEQEKNKFSEEEVTILLQNIINEIEIRKQNIISKSETMSVHLLEGGCMAFESSQDVVKEQVKQLNK